MHVCICSLADLFMSYFCTIEMGPIGGSCFLDAGRIRQTADRVNWDRSTDGFPKEIPFSEAGEVPRGFEKKIRPLSKM